MTKRKPRGLHPDEAELWDRVRRTATPLSMSTKQTLRDAIETEKPMPAPKPIAKFEIGQKTTSTAPHTQYISPKPSKPAVHMDRKNFDRMKSGKLSPERRIDLHGMTVAQALPVLTRFILDAQAHGLRLVLVITGKGKVRDQGGPIPERFGVLRQQVPHWLHSAPLKPLVLQVSEAHFRHGGSGAYYVYLRRNRQ